MGYYNEELHHRQQTGDVGHAVLANINSAGEKRRWRLFLIPLLVLAAGLVLMFVGPVPGLGIAMVFGGIMMLPIVAIKAFLSP